MSVLARSSWAVVGTGKGNFWEMAARASRVGAVAFANSGSMITVVREDVFGAEADMPSASVPDEATMITWAFLFCFHLFLFFCAVDV